MRPVRGARNMAVDHALMESVQAGGRPALRLYAWEPACLSFGRNQHTRGVYDAARLAAAGIDVVRRPTGGLAVLHDRELTYCVAAPVEPFGGPRAAYLRINEALVAGLRTLGVPAVIAAAAGTPDPRRDTAHPCFQAPAAGEIMAGGRKLVGSAQRCERRTVLQHGSVLVGGSQAAVRGLLHSSHRAGNEAATDEVDATSLEQILGRTPPLAEVAAAIAAGFRSRCGTCLAPDTLTREEKVRVRELEHEYGAPSWTWRR